MGEKRFWVYNGFQKQDVFETTKPQFCRVPKISLEILEPKKLISFCMVAETEYFGNLKTAVLYDCEKKE